MGMLLDLIPKPPTCAQHGSSRYNPECELWARWAFDWLDAVKVHFPDACLGWKDRLDDNQRDPVMYRSKEDRAAERDGDWFYGIVQKSSGNVFADLGLDNPDERMRKAEERLAREIADGTLKFVG